MSFAVRKIVTGNNGTLIAAITDSKLAVIFDIPARRVVAPIPLLEDTGFRVAFDASADRFLLGSWRNGLTCLELSTGKTIWKKKLEGFTYTGFIPRTNQVYVAGGKTIGSLILDLESGEKFEELRDIDELKTKSSLMVGLNKVKKKIQFYDNSWRLIGIADWKTWGIWDFSCNEEGIYVVSGPGSYTASFAPGVESPLAEVEKSEYLDCFEAIYWSKLHGCFFAVASFFQGEPGLSLVKLDHTLWSAELVRKLPSADIKIIEDGGYLVSSTGLILDLNAGQDVSNIQWSTVV